MITVIMPSQVSKDRPTWAIGSPIACVVSFLFLGTLPALSPFTDDTEKSVQRPAFPERKLPADVKIVFVVIKLRLRCGSRVRAKF